MLLGLLLSACLCRASAGAPQTVRAAVVTAPTTDRRVHLELVEVVDVPYPTLWPGHALVRVAASSVNPCDWKFPFLSPNPLWRYPKVLLLDFAGEIVDRSPGAACEALAPGDAVWGMAQAGAAAEVVSVPCANIGRAPASLPQREAAVLPLVALTGLQGFRWAGGSEWLVGKTVLVLGGSGGTGHAGIQLAKAMGAARVITTCSTGNFEFVKALGADQVIDHHAQRWEEVIPETSLDMIYDCVCETGTGEKAYPLLKDGGRFVTLLPQALASAATAQARPQVRQTFYLLDQTSTAALDALRSFADAGQLHGRINATYPLGAMREAFSASIAGHVVGKLAIDVAPNDFVVV